MNAASQIFLLINLLMINDNSTQLLISNFLDDSFYGIKFCAWHVNILGKSRYHPNRLGIQIAIHERKVSIPYAGRLFTKDFVQAAIASTIDFWHTLGDEGKVFQKALAVFWCVRQSLLLNSGSSASLVEISELLPPKLLDERRNNSIDVLISVVAGFSINVSSSKLEWLLSLWMRIQSPTMRAVINRSWLTAQVKLGQWWWHMLLVITSICQPFWLLP